MVVTAVAVEMMATYVAMVKEIVIRTANVPAVLFVDTIIVNNLEAVLITLMTAVYQGVKYSLYSIRGSFGTKLCCFQTCH